MFCACLRANLPNFFPRLRNVEFGSAGTSPAADAPSEPIDTPLFLWNTMPEGLLTLILQRAILGLEAYLPGTVYVQLGGKPGYEEHVMRYVANPARLCRSIADAYFNRLPTLINPAHALRAANPELWLRTKRLYDEV